MSDFPTMQGAGVENPGVSTMVRAGRATYIGTAVPNLQGEPAIVLVDQRYPWLALAQFDNSESFAYWSHGWHPLPASSFGPVDYDHDWVGCDHDWVSPSLTTAAVDAKCSKCGVHEEDTPVDVCTHCGVKDSTFEQFFTPCLGVETPIAWSTRQRVVPVLGSAAFLEQYK